MNQIKPIIWFSDEGSSEVAWHSSHRGGILDSALTAALKY